MRKRPAVSQEGPLRAPSGFDDTMRRAISVKPPKEGWAAYFEKTKTTPKPRPKKRKRAA